MRSIGSEGHGGVDLFLDELVLGLCFGEGVDGEKEVVDSVCGEERYFGGCVHEASVWEMQLFGAKIFLH